MHDICRCLIGPWIINVADEYKYGLVMQLTLHYAQEKSQNFSQLVA